MFDTKTTFKLNVILRKNKFKKSNRDTELAPPPPPPPPPPPTLPPPPPPPPAPPPPVPIRTFLGVDTPVLLVPSLRGKCTFLVSRDSSVTHSSKRLLTAK